MAHPGTTLSKQKFLYIRTIRRRWLISNLSAYKNEKPPGVFYGSTMETTISTLPPDTFDFELQSQQSDGIRVQNDIRYDSDTVV